MKTMAVLVLGLVIGSAPMVRAGSQAAAPQKPAPPPAAAQQPPPAAAQQPPPATPPAAAKPRPARPASSGRESMTVFVTDVSGTPIPDVKVRVTGPVMREVRTTREGTVRIPGLRPGSYRLRYDADGFITLEQDVALKAAGTEIEATLDRASVPPKAPEPAAVPQPAPNTAAALPPADPNATAEVVSVVDWLAKNGLKRGEPRKESVVARSAGEAASVLQVRDALRDRSHAEADEVIYVINGSAQFTSKGRVVSLDTGALLLVPRGVTYTLENRGDKPLWALSVVSPGGGEKP